ncbi:MAG: fibronectin type III domain-containing protein [Myxococcota bacterium]
MGRRAPVLVLLPVLLLAGCTGPLELPWPYAEEPAPLHPPLVAHPPAPLPAPEGLRATSGEYRQVPLQWDPLLTGEVGGYRIERADAREGPFAPLVDVWGRGAIARVDGAGAAPLGDGVTHYYRLRAFSPDGRLSEQVSEVVVGSTAPLPDAPTGLRAYSRQPREVPLSWHASDDPTVAGYVVLRSPSPDGPFEPIAELVGRHTTSHVDGELGDLRVFYYRVAARNPDGVAGEPSPAVRAVTKPEPLPPLGLRVAERRLGAIELAWEPNVEEDLEAYRLYRTESGAAPQRVAEVPADATRAVDRGVAAGAAITWVLVAVDRDGLESRPSQPVTASGLDYGLRGEATPTGVRLRWNPRTDEGFVGARVERLGWLGGQVLGSSADGSFTDTDVRPGGVYRYVVVLVRAGGGEAPPSPAIDVRVPQTGDFR